jgi:hypothetical protein
LALSFVSSSADERQGAAPAMSVAAANLEGETLG